MNNVGIKTFFSELTKLIGSMLIVTGALAAYLCWGYAVGEGPDLNAAMLMGWLKGLAAAAVFITGDWPVVWLPAVVLYAMAIIWRYSRPKLLKNRY